MVSMVSLLLSIPCYAQSIDLSPESDGSINVAANLGWDYDSAWSGSVRLWTQNTSLVDEASPGEGLEQSLTTIQKQASGELVPLAFKSGDFDLGLSLKGDYLNIRETGFVDFRQFGASADPVIRLFFNNRRGIIAIKPGLALGWSLSGEVGSLSLDARYAPLIWLGMDQILSTAADGNDYDTPTTHHSWQGFSTNSFGMQIKSSLDLARLSIDFEGGLEGTLFDYEYLQIGGGTGSQSVWNLDAAANFFLSLSSFRIKGLVPRLGVGWIWNASYAHDSPAKPVLESKWQVNLGFRGNS